MQADRLVPTPAELEGTTAQILAAVGILITGAVLLSLAGDVGDGIRPFTLPGAPFGTYAQPTQLGLLGLAISLGALFAGSVLAFARPRSASASLVAGSLVMMILWAVWWPSWPPGDVARWVPLILFVAPPLATAAMLRLLLRDQGGHGV